MHLLNETLMLFGSSGDEGMFYLGEHWDGCGQTLAPSRLSTMRSQGCAQAP